MTEEARLENDDLFFVDVPSNVRPVSDEDLDNDIEIRSALGLQAPPIPDSNEALVEEDDNAAALAELEDVPMAAKKKRTINRGPKLDTKRLLSARGLPAISSCFKEIKLKGKGHEEDDLALVMSTFEHWAHRLYPRLTFDDCLEKIETLGQKREIQTCLKKIRMGMPILDDDFQTTVITTDGPQPVEDSAPVHNDEAPSTSYVDIFPARSAPSSSSQRETVASASLGPPTMPSGFSPADFS